MQSVLTALRNTLDEGHHAVLATVVRVFRSAPRGPGAAMMLDDRGNVPGSVSGGCVETDLYERMRHVIDTGQPELIEYGISDEQVFEVGLSCGGTITIFVERLDQNVKTLLDAYAKAIREKQPAALVSFIDGLH